MKTNDRQITDIMKDVSTAAAQLPDFQRPWVWEDNRIRALIFSIIRGFPVGAAMFLKYGNDDVRFQYRPITGVSVQGVVPDELILDGQQRLTSIYSAMCSKNAVATKTDKGDAIERFYYLDIELALDDTATVDDIVLSIPKSKKKTSDFGRKVDLDLSDPEKEYKNKKFPLNIILDYPEMQKWQNQYYAYHNYDSVITQQFISFSDKVIMPTMKYEMPVISLDKNTSKEAVCQVFENVNTGGVSLTVFELVTAVFAMDDFRLRTDWEQRKEKYLSGDILKVVEPSDFLTALTLLASYKKGGTVSCKKRDVLSLKLDDYKKHADNLTEGFIEAEKLLQEERIFTSNDLPYTTQLIPLATICTALIERNELNITTVKDKIKQWYWCGVLGEMYGGANETRYVLDMTGVMEWITADGPLPRTIQESFFNPIRLLGLKSRLSAAYKGLNALILKNHCRDFISGREMDFVAFKDENIDIHHIFPRDYCQKKRLPKGKWDSIVNKTPITYKTNRMIGGLAPSEYLEKIAEKKQVSPQVLDEYLISHWIEPQMCREDNFDSFIINRAQFLLDAIETATGKAISGRDSEDVVSAFGGKLSNE